MRILLILGALAALLLAGQAQAGCRYKRLGSIPLEWRRQGPLIDGTANGQPVKVLVDTGATGLFVTAALGDKLHLALRHGYESVVGVGGESQVYIARLDQLTLGKFAWDKAPVQVLQATVPGLADVIVGADFLFQKDVEFTEHALSFYQPDGCDGVALAFWAPDVPFIPLVEPDEHDRHAYARVMVNGQPVMTLIDTGASRTMLDAPTAAQLGFDTKAHPADAHTVGGIGAHEAKTWSATFETLAVGPEIIHRPHIEVSDMWRNTLLDARSMEGERWADGLEHLWLGADFLRAHHLLFAISQRRLYFSYEGGAIFATPTEPLPAADGPVADGPSAIMGQ